MTYESKVMLDKQDPEDRDDERLILTRGADDDAGEPPPRLGALTGLEVITFRNDLYRHWSRSALQLALVVVLVQILTLAFALWVYLDRPEPRYFATTQDGRIVPLTPLSAPNIGREALLQWAVAATTKAFTLDFRHWRAQLQALQDYFTDEGYEAYLTALKQSDNISAVRERKLVVSAVTTRPPVILQSGVLRGAYAWRVQVPVHIRYESSSHQGSDEVIVTLLIERIPTLTSSQGIGISQFVVREANHSAL